MLEKFEKGKRYRFCKDILLQNEPMRKNYEISASIRYWVDLIDMHEVELDNINDGYIGDYGVLPEWCEEII